MPHVPGTLELVRMNREGVRLKMILKAVHCLKTLA